MRLLFSTHEVHSRDRFDYWHDVACKTFGEHHAAPERRHDFHAAIEVGALIDIGVVVFENSPMNIARTARHVARDRTDDLFLCRQMAGHFAVEQESRDVVLHAGDMVLLDPLLPYQGVFGGSSQMLVVIVPRPMLEARVGKTRDMVARLLRPFAGESGLASSMLAMLPAHVGGMSAAAQATIRDQTLDLIALTLAGAMDARQPVLSSAGRASLLRVRAAIEGRLTNPALDAAAVAAAAGISVRYANALLAQEDMSITRLIQARRLTRCRKALEDPSQAHRTVSEIAYGWGFCDMTHFGRKFKKAFGAPPSAYRRGHHGRERA